MSRRLLSLRAKIAILIGGTVIGLAAAILFALGLAARHEIGRVVENDVEATGSVLARILQERSTALTDMCVLLERQPFILRIIETRDSATITDSIREWLGKIRADAALVTDDSGGQLGVTDGLPMTTNVDAGIKMALQGTTWSGVVMRNGNLALAVSVPVMRRPSKTVVIGTFTA